MSAITPIKMPKWGLSMIEGKIVEWHKAEGAAVAEGEDLVDVETSKITNVAEAPAAGVLRRIVAQPDQTLPVGALMAVVAGAEVSEGDIDAFICDFQSRFTPETDAVAEGGAPSRAISANGRALNVAVFGEDKHDVPALLIHGFSADANNWLFTAPALAQQRPVYALDLPGHGASEKDVGDGSLAFLAATVAAAMDALDVAKAHIVGHSLGGAIAMQLALDAPEKVASVSLLDSAGLPGGIVNLEFLNGIAHNTRAKDIKPFLEMLFAVPEIVSKEMVDLMVKYKRLDGVEEALTTLINTLTGTRQQETLPVDLASIPAALVIASRNDKIVGAPDPAKLPADWSVIFMDHTGHMTHLEAAAEVNAALSAHFARH